MVSTALRKTKTAEDSELDPWKLFLNAMRSPVKCYRYSTRVAKFLEVKQHATLTLLPTALKSYVKLFSKSRLFARTFICKAVYLQGCLFARPFICKAVYLQGRLFARPSICKAVYLQGRLFLKSS